MEENFEPQYWAYGDSLGLPVGSWFAHEEPAITPKLSLRIASPFRPVNRFPRLPAILFGVFVLVEEFIHGALECVGVDGEPHGGWGCVAGQVIANRSEIGEGVAKLNCSANDVAPLHSTDSHDAAKP